MDCEYSSSYIVDSLAIHPFINPIISLFTSATKKTSGKVLIRFSKDSLVAASYFGKQIDSTLVTASKSCSVTFLIISSIINLHKIIITIIVQYNLNTIN